MIPKAKKLIVTFYTTADAMAMEKVCRAEGAPGRLIPVPRCISAGCGLAWCAAPESREALRRVMQANGIVCQEICECII